MKIHSLDWKHHVSNTTKDMNCGIFGIFHRKEVQMNAALDLVLMFFIVNYFLIHISYKMNLFWTRDVVTYLF